MLLKNDSLYIEKDYRLFILLPIYYRTELIKNLLSALNEYLHISFGVFFIK